MPNQTRDEQIIAGLAIVDQVVRKLARDKWAPFEDDMRSVATVTLVKLTDKRGQLDVKNWDGYLYRALRWEAIREAKKLWGKEEEGWSAEDVDLLTAAQRRRAPYERIPQELIEERLMVPDVGPAVLAKIDRARTHDFGWRERERFYPFFLVARAIFRRRQARWTAREQYIWQARRVWNRPIGEVAREIGVDPYTLQKMERALVSRAGEG